MRNAAYLAALVMLPISLSAAPAKSLSGNKAVLQRLYDAFNANDTMALERVVAENAVAHDLPEGVGKGQRGTEALLVLLNRAFPDFKIIVQDMIAEGDRVAARIMFTGSHQGEFLGIPRTGRQVAYTGIQYFRFANGKAVEMWSFMDHERLRRQLTPATKPAPAAAPKSGPSATPSGKEARDF